MECTVNSPLECQLDFPQNKHACTHSSHAGRWNSSLYNQNTPVYFSQDINVVPSSRLLLPVLGNCLFGLSLENTWSLFWMTWVHSCRRYYWTHVDIIVHSIEVEHLNSSTSSRIWSKSSALPPPPCAGGVRGYAACSERCLLWACPAGQLCWTKTPVIQLDPTFDVFFLQICSEGGYAVAQPIIQLQYAQSDYLMVPICWDAACFPFSQFAFSLPPLIKKLKVGPTSFPLCLSPLSRR